MSNIMHGTTQHAGHGRSLQPSPLPTFVFPQPAFTIPQPRLYYFISRSNGALTPLIPADELPFNIRLQGVPRKMELHQTQGMQHIGSLPFTGQVFKVEELPIAKPSQIQHQETSHAPSQSDGTKKFAAPDAHLRHAQGQANVAPTLTIPPPSLPQRLVHPSAGATSWRQTAHGDIDKTQAKIDDILKANQKTATPATNTGKPSTPTLGQASEEAKKKYCTYWIRHGDCDYMQQGCLYKHEMPDKATLAKIGFRTVPRWWQEKCAVKLGGSALPTVGTPAHPMSWLKNKAGRGSDADDESESESSESESEPEDEEELKKTSVVVEKKEMKTEPDNTIPVPQPRAPVIEPVDSRKLSVCSDLIMLTPLLPTPSSSACSAVSSSASTASLTPASSANSSPRSTESAWPSSPITPPTPTFPPRVHKLNQIFIPRGESAEHHVAEAKKRASRTNGHGHSNGLTKPQAIKTKFAESKKSFQLLQRPKTDVAVSKHIPTSFPASDAAAGAKATQLSKQKANAGLLASKHAPSSSLSDNSMPKRAKFITPPRRHARRPQVAEKKAVLSASTAAVNAGVKKD